MDETRKLVENEGRRCVTFIADVRDGKALKDAAALGVKEFDRIDAVCANAGVCTFHKDGSLSIDDDVYDLVVDTNLKGVWNTIRATAPHLINAGGGSIVITSSAAGIRGQVPYAHYVASKHGVVGLMKAFANELAPHGISAGRRPIRMSQCSSARMRLSSTASRIGTQLSASVFIVASDPMSPAAS